MINVGVRQDNTWLVVDPIVGCGHDCQYCFLTTYGETKKRGRVTMSPQEAINRLTNYWAFRQSSMVMIGSETDMFMNAHNIRFLSEFVRLYDQVGIPNPLSLSTKSHIPDEFIRLVQGLKNAKIVFYISYSGLPEEIERFVNREKVIGNFKRLADAGQSIIHFWRPMLPQNSTPDVLEEVIGNVYQYATCSVTRGLNLNHELQQAAWYWPEIRDTSIDFSETVSIWPEQAKDNLDRIIEKYRPYPVFFKNSCALAHVLGRPDFGAVFRSGRCSRASCPPTQRQLCEADHLTRSWPSTEKVKAELSSLGLSNSVAIEDKVGKVIISGSLNHEQVACLAQVLRTKLVVEDIRSEHEWGGYVLGHSDRLIPLVASTGQAYVKETDTEF